MMEATIRDPIKADPAVNDLTALHTMHIGPRAVLVVAQVKFRGELTVAEIEAAVGRLARSIMPLAGAQTTRRMIVIGRRRRGATSPPRRVEPLGGVASRVGEVATEPARRGVSPSRPRTPPSA
jgi:hypothetical protein